MSKRLVTIHQPDFLPWLGFFVKVWRADVFVILDHVKNNPRTGSWFRRVKFVIAGEAKWVSIPLRRPLNDAFVRIDQMQISDNINAQKAFKKYLLSVQQNYKKAPYFRKYFPMFEHYFQSDVCLLKQRNVEFILAVLDVLKIRTEVSYSSEMDCRHSANELNLEIVKLVSGTSYLSGDGASGYQDEALFLESGIEVLYNKFTPFAYDQCNTDFFIPGLSILDALMNIGSHGVKEMIERNGKVG